VKDTTNLATGRFTVKPGTARVGETHNFPVPRLCDKESAPSKIWGHPFGDVLEGADFSRLATPLTMRSSVARSRSGRAPVIRAPMPQTLA